MELRDNNENAIAGSTSAAVANDNLCWKSMSPTSDEISVSSSLISPANVPTCPPRAIIYNVLLIVYPYFGPPYI